METLEHNSSNQTRQKLLDTIHQLPDSLVQEVIQFADYLLYKERSVAQAEGSTEEKALPEGKSTGYQKMKASGLIGFGKAEADLSETYKARYAAEIAEKYDHS